MSAALRFQDARPAPVAREQPSLGEESALRALRRLGLTVDTALQVVLEREPSPSSDHAERERTRARRLQRAARAICRVNGVELEVRGLVPDEACVLVSNHVSYLDPLLVAAELPCRPIAKAELAGWPLVGRGATKLGTLFVRRGDPYSGSSVLRRAAAALAQGVPVLNFPEGTTSDRLEPLPFRRGIFGLARLAGVPVVPVHLGLDRGLSWTGDALFLPHFLRFSARARTHVTLSFGAPLSARGTNAGELAARARAQVIALSRRHS